MKKLILIFSNKTGLDNNGYNFFDTSFLNEASMPLLINSNGISNSAKDSHIIIIQDVSYSDLKEDEMVMTVLKEIKECAEQNNIKLYLIYHRKENQDFGNENHNEDNLAIFYNEQIKFAIGQSHISGSIYDVELRNIEDAIQSKNAESYKKAIESIIKRFGDPVLESQLNFLHRCLTPDGLQKEETLKSEWAALNEFKSLTEVKPEEGKAEVDPFGDNYLSALRTLRDKLLVS